MILCRYTEWDSSPRSHDTIYLTLAISRLEDSFRGTSIALRISYNLIAHQEAKIRYVLSFIVPHESWSNVHVRIAVLKRRLVGLFSWFSHTASCLLLVRRRKNRFYEITSRTHWQRIPFTLGHLAAFRTHKKLFRCSFHETQTNPQPPLPASVDCVQNSIG